MTSADHDALLVATLGLLDGRADALDHPGLAAMRADAAAFRTAGFASGLTAALATLAGRAGAALPPAWTAYCADQRAEVSARLARFEPVLAIALGALHDAGVAALPVKGAVLAAEVWPDAGLVGSRPMSDLDLLVAAGARSAAVGALAACGYRLIERNDWEDTFLAWGDGSVGRLDGESAEHNGKIELHPGWVERLHHYLVDDGGVLVAQARAGRLAGRPCLRLDDAALTLHVLGHLAATVVRAEVRPVHVLDAVLCLERLDDGGRRRLAMLAQQVDARLVAPALWLVARYRPAAVPDGLEAASLARLGRRARAQLGRTDRRAVLRDAGRRTDLAWREAFTGSTGERLAVARQALVPPAVERRDGRGPFGLGTQLRRVGRAARRR
ncbi:MAG: nucleotidyltransferase family protein [Acidimicrobiales bacterium]|nr:nucleotidyltransferase family protein [Acidimicrobiales bacterium]